MQTYWCNKREDRIVLNVKQNLIKLNDDHQETFRKMFRSIDRCRSTSSKVTANNFMDVCF